jgi:hypothetical protein
MILPAFKTCIATCFEEDVGAYKLSLLNLMLINKDKGVVDLNQDPFEISIYKNDDGFWMENFGKDDAILYADKDFVDALETTETPCSSF